MVLTGDHFMFFAYSLNNNKRIQEAALIDSQIATEFVDSDKIQKQLVSCMVLSLFYVHVRIRDLGVSCSFLFCIFHNFASFIY